MSREYTVCINTLHKEDNYDDDDDDDDDNNNNNNNNNNNCYNSNDDPFLSDQMPDTHVDKFSRDLVVLFRISEGSFSQLQSAQDEFDIQRTVHRDIFL